MKMMKVVSFSTRLSKNWTPTTIAIKNDEVGSNSSKVIKFC